MLFLVMSSMTCLHIACSYILVLALWPLIAATCGVLPVILNRPIIVPNELAVPIYTTALHVDVVVF